MARGRGAAARRRRRRARSGADAQRLSRRARGRALDRGARAASRTCRSSSGRRATFDEQVERGDFGGLVAIGGVGVGASAERGVGQPEGLARVQAFLEAISLVTDLDENDPEASSVTLDDAALREGSRVPGRVPHRSRRRRVPARAQPRRSRRARRGTPALLRRHHARRGAAVPVSRVEPHDVRLDRLPAAEPVPRRDPRRADRWRSATRSGAARALGRQRGAVGGGGLGAHRDAVVAAAMRRDNEQPPAGARRGAARACASATTCTTTSSATA